MIVDFSAHFGRGPAIDQHCTPAELRSLLSSAGIDRAVVSDLGAAFGDEAPDIPLPETMVAFASVSPDDGPSRVRSVKGIRIYPTYQPWDFSNGALRSLLAAARDADLIVQVYLRLQDPRALPVIAAPDAVLSSLGPIIEGNKNVRFVISGANYRELAANAALFSHGNLWADTSHIQHPINSIAKLVRAIGPTRVLFGSNAPVFYPHSGIFQILHSPISDAEKERILGGNAVELLG